MVGLRWLLVGLLAAASATASCAESPCAHGPLPPGVLAENATLLVVSPAQDFLYYQKRPARVGEDVPAGALCIEPLGGGAPLRVREAQLIGETLVGDDWLWNRRLGNPWSPPGPDVKGLFPTPDGRAVEYRPNGFSGAIKRVYLDDCDRNGCRSQVLVELDAETSGVWRASDDGRYVALAGGHQLILTDSTRASRTVLAEAANDFYDMRFSRDATLLAAVEPGSNSLAVFSTESGARLPWPAPPPGLWSYQFLADNSILAVGPQTFRVSAAAITDVTGEARLAAQPGFELFGERYFFAGPGTGVIGPFPLLAWDITAAGSPPVTFSDAGILPEVDDALTRVTFIEETAPNALALSSLPDGARLATLPIRTTFSDYQSWLRRERSFVAGSTALLHMGTDDMLRLWRNDVETVVAKNVETFGTRSSPDNVYYEDSSGTIRRLPLP
jgi:hypothetical protein